MNSSTTSLTPLETALLASASAFFGDPQQAAAQEAARQEAKRAAQQRSPERVYRAALKPLFKEWLELRFDFAATRGPYRKMGEDPSVALFRPLLQRTTRLVVVMVELKQPSPAEIMNVDQERLVLFHRWLRGQVEALVEAIKKSATDKEDGGSGGGGGNNGQPPPPSSSPSTPQYSPLTPTSSFSPSPVVGSLNDSGFFNR